MYGKKKSCIEFCIFNIFYGFLEYFKTFDDIKGEIVLVNISKDIQSYINRNFRMRSSDQNFYDFLKNFSNNAKGLLISSTTIGFYEYFMKIFRAP